MMAGCVFGLRNTRSAERLVQQLPSQEEGPSTKLISFFGLQVLVEHTT
jgi:hypothetical protein